MKKASYFCFFLLILGFYIPQSLKIPVVGATSRSYHPKSFWYYPWGKSVTHKGVDIFAKKGTSIFSATKGVVIYTGKLDMGGNVILVLGPNGDYTIKHIYKK